MKKDLTINGIRYKNPFWILNWRMHKKHYIITEVEKPMELIDQIRNNKKEEYYCPVCNDILDKQEYFYSKTVVYRCLNCGTNLYNPNVYKGEIYPDIYWHCDECGDLLNAQEGFKDDCGTWCCSECGHKNKIDESEIRS